MAKKKIRFKPAMTSGELVALIQQLDPTGELPVALLGSGAVLRAVDEVTHDTLHVPTPEACKRYPENRTYAVSGRYMDDISKKLCPVQKGHVLVIE